MILYLQFVLSAGAIVLLGLAIVLFATMIPGAVVAALLILIDLPLLVWMIRKLPEAWG